ncbi:MAG: hypothetical protein BroJett010_05690 [Gammaproteobacteria bacterium]|nr:hypothetical protein [Gammaproteobacteria bacterium PRO8]MCL4776058.1 hypothetical protein [Gammaproteobacteria bacterium]MDL1880320.1 hypothetical protein [Gammaproteobacteria bacterium PRO2]GIK34010.1 MAG: hypothetical protein BroJett010_05690 [Gammaproteobacteria bacterium]
MDQTLRGHGMPGEADWMTDSALASLSLRQRSTLLDLDRQLHAHWGLGRNLVLAWCPYESGVLALVVPHYAVAEYASASGAADAPDAARQEFVARLLSGPRRFELRQISNAARLLQAEPAYLALRQPLDGSAEETRLIDRMVRRYGVSYVPSRAVALFDIVGFSLLRPFEQMTQLNSLAHSLNSAHSKMIGSRVNVNFARSGTGDGFYIWNRDLGVEANTNLYHLMHLVLADNAIARRKAVGRAVPLLRACFHAGSCYEFHHAEGLNPTLYTQIVGDVTIELARMIERALPGQILVGDFQASLPDDDSATGRSFDLDAVQFMDRARDNLARLNGLELAGEAIESIKCYLTGRARADGTFTIRRLAISDKHGLTHRVFNAKVNIYRRAAEPILLGIEDRYLQGEHAPLPTAGHIVRPGATH